MRLLTLFFAGLLSVNQVLAFQGTAQESPEVPQKVKPAEDETPEKKSAEEEKPAVEEKPADELPKTLPAGVVRVETVWVDDDRRRVCRLGIEASLGAGTGCLSQITL